MTNKKDDLKDISFADAKEPEDIDKILREKIGIGLLECSQALSDALANRADELAPDLPNVAPYGKYDKLIEDQESILQFIKEEAIKPENWTVSFVDAKESLMQLTFLNKSVDDGDTLKGHVFVGKSGKIRHAFAQVGH